MLNNKKMLTVACISKYAAALPTVYQLGLLLGAGGLAGGGAYLLSGLADPKRKHRLARALASALVGAGAGAGATYAGNYYANKAWEDAVVDSGNYLALAAPPEMINVSGILPRRTERGGWSMRSNPLFGLGPSHLDAIKNAGQRLLMRSSK